MSPEEEDEEESTTETIEGEGEERKDPLADLFEVPQPDDNDMNTDHLLESYKSEDVFDLISVSDEDIIGKAPGTPASHGEKPQRYRTPPKHKRATYKLAPPTSMGGVRS